MKENGYFRRKKYLFVTGLDLIETDQIAEIVSYVRTYFWVTIYYKYDEVLYS